MKKKGILAWFEYDRRMELLQPFIDISDEIEFVHLFFRTRDERQVDLSPFKRIYWFDYKTPYQLLDDHKPDFIIGTTEGLLAISLMVAAKERNIPSYGLQHGFSTETFVSIVKKVYRDPPVLGPVLKKHLRTTLFYFTSLRLKHIGRIFQYINLFILFYKKIPEEAIIRNRYKWVKPDYYLCFSEISDGHYRYIYGLNDAEIKYIGIPSFDKLFRELDSAKHEHNGERYYLLIDTSFIDYHKDISDDQIYRCYNTLKEYARQHNARLYIKLHPRNYGNEGLHDDETISFVRNAEMKDLARLIVNALGCFGFYSTLTMPIAFTIPTIQIKYDDIYEKGLANNNITPVLDFYTFKAGDIHFEYANNGEALKTKFLYATDGRSAERIKDILLA
jgi:hypothetical protein